MCRVRKSCLQNVSKKFYSKEKKASTITEEQLCDRIRTVAKSIATPVFLYPYRFVLFPDRYVCSRIMFYIYYGSPAIAPYLFDHPLRTCMYRVLHFSRWVCSKILMFVCFLCCWFEGFVNYFTHSLLSPIKNLISFRLHCTIPLVSLNTLNNHCQFERSVVMLLVILLQSHPPYAAG